jgi:hypothetical protein
MGRANGPLKAVAMATVSSVLADHVSLRVASVDRLAIAGYIPKLSYEGGLVKFLLHRAAQAHYEINIPSPALLGHNHDRMVAELERFVARRDLPVLRFKRGDVKELIARPYQLAAAAAGRDGFVLLGKAQERQLAWAGYKDENSKLSIARHPHFSFSRQARVPDQWYFYLWDHQWGPAFIKLSAYAPYPLWLAANGHEWAKRQLVAAGVGFAELDNGLWRVEDPETAHRVCARLSAGHVGDLIARWLPELPSPLTSADRAAGFDWAFSIRQMEISDTAVFDRPQVGRAWFEAAIKDHLDLGRPDKVRLVFDRRVQLKGTKSHQTPGRFSTQVVTRGVHPRIEARYKSSQVKAYFKQQRALRVETTINNPRDFGVNKTLNTSNWRALRHIGAGVNARFLQALSEGNGTVPDGQLLADVVLPSVHDGQRAPGLRFGEAPRRSAARSAVLHRASLRRSHQRHPASAGLRPARSRLPRQPGHLRPAPPAAERPHRTHRPHQPLPRHRIRTPRRHLLHPPVQTSRRPRPGRAGRPPTSAARHAAATHRRVARLRPTGPTVAETFRHRRLNTHRQPATRLARRTSAPKHPATTQDLTPTPAP